MKKQCFVLFVVVLVASFFTSLAFAEMFVDTEGNVVELGFSSLTTEGVVACKTGREVPIESTGIVKTKRISLLYSVRFKEYSEVVVCKNMKLQIIKKQQTASISGENETAIDYVCFIFGGIFFVMFANFIIGTCGVGDKRSLTDLAWNFSWFVLFLAVVPSFVIFNINEIHPAIIPWFCLADVAFVFTAISFMLVKNERWVRAYWLCSLLYYITAVGVMFS